MIYSTRRNVGLKVTYDKSFNNTFTDVQEALNMVGNVSIAYNKIIEGTARYGLQKVYFKITIIPQGEKSIISIQAHGDDVLGIGAQKCIKRLLDALNNLGNPNYKPSKSGISLLKISFLVMATVIISIFFGILPAFVFVLILYFISIAKNIGL